MRPSYYLAQITQLEKLVCAIVSTLCCAFKKWVKQKADKARWSFFSNRPDLLLSTSAERRFAALSTRLACSTLVLLHLNTKLSAHKPCNVHKSALFSVHSQGKNCLFSLLLCNLSLDLFSCFHFPHQQQQACRFVCVLQHPMQLQRN